MVLFTGTAVFVIFILLVLEAKKINAAGLLENTESFKDKINSKNNGRKSFDEILESLRFLRKEMNDFRQLDTTKPSKYVTINSYMSNTCSGYPTKSDSIGIGVCYIAAKSSSTSPLMVSVMVNKTLVSVNYFSGKNCTGKPTSASYTFPISSACTQVSTGVYSTSNITTSVAMTGTVVR